MNEAARSAAKKPDRGEPGAGAAGTGTPASALRRNFLARSLAGLLAGISLAAAAPRAQAQDGRREQRSGRLDPGERDRLRRDLRERGAEGGQRAAPAPRKAPQRREPARGKPGRLSEEERQQLRRQLHEAGRRGR